jgi:Ca-activated chloride channel family protein
LGGAVALLFVAPVPAARPAQSASSPASQSQSPRGVAAHEAQGDSEIEVVETNLATVLMTATDRKGRLVTALKAEDVRVSEDGVPQRVTTFERQTGRPLSLALVFDTSGSQARTLPDQKTAARLFLRSIFRPDRDRAAVVSFSGGALLQQSFTNDLARLEDAVGRVGEPRPPFSNAAPARATGGGTAVYDALFLTCYKVLTKAQPDTRRAVILLTDGLDNGSRLRARDAVNGAAYANAVVYGIGIGQTIDEDALSSVAEETAGRAFFPADDGELRAAFARIEQELRSQYLVAYTPTNKAHDGKRRNVRVEIADPQLAKGKVKLAYRSYYYVGKSGAPRR